MSASASNVRPHVAQNGSGRRLAIDRRTTRHPATKSRVSVQHVADRPCAVTLGADRGYDAADFVEELRAITM
jgi:hypothetical protein